MKTSNYFYIIFYGTLGLLFSSIFFDEIQFSWIGMIGIMLSWVPIVIFLLHFENKENKKEHDETCKCTCGNCCKRENIIKEKNEL